MHAPHRRRWRHLRRALGYGGLVALILLAALVGLTNQLLPAVERHPEDVAAWLSERVGQPVRFSAIDARWTRRGPRLSLRDLEVGEGDATLAVGEAELQLSVYSGLLPGMPLTELSVDGLALTLHQDAEGRWRVEGLPRPRADGVDPLEKHRVAALANSRCGAVEKWWAEETPGSATIRLYLTFATVD
ncbi:MAG: hypothetical protein LW828_08910, partial [Xanthomonadaceae bacterium]|nr:hypothetical protein [Xanthomonadaceae bacterium]